MENGFDLVSTVCRKISKYRKIGTLFNISSELLHMETWKISLGVLQTDIE